MKNSEKSPPKPSKSVFTFLIVISLVLTPLAGLLFYYFPRLNLEPSYVSGGYNWVEKFNLAQGEIYIKPIYLDYGEAINCFYFSNVPITFYVFDLNSFLSYLRNPISQEIAELKASYFGFVRFMPSSPGYCWILIVNPVRFYHAKGEITFYKYYAAPIITSNTQHTCCLYVTISGIIILALGIAFHITANKLGKEEQKV